MMRKTAYAILSAVPARVGSALTFILSIWSVGDPDGFKLWWGWAMTPDHVRFLGVGGCVAFAVYLLAVTWLKPKSDIAIPASATAQAPASSAIGTMTGGAVYNVVLNQIPDHQPPSQPISPEAEYGSGFTVYIVLRLTQFEPGRRQYILYTGNNNENGFSLYISNDGLFRFELRNSSGEPFSISAPMGRKGVPIAEHIFITAVAGFSDVGAVMQMYVNRDLITSQNWSFPLRADVSKLLDGLTIGASRYKDQNAALIMSEVLVYSVMHSSLDKEQCWDFIEQKHSLKGR